MKPCSIRPRRRPRRRACRCRLTAPETSSESRFRLKSGLNSLNAGSAGPEPARIDRLVSASCGCTGADVDRLQQLGLQQFTHPSDFVARERGVDIRKKSMTGVVGRIAVDRIPPLHQGKLLESEIAVDPTQTGTPRRQILIEEQSRAINCPVVVQLDRPLEILQCLDRPVERLLPNRIVKPRRRIVSDRAASPARTARPEAARASPRNTPSPDSSA